MYRSSRISNFAPVLLAGLVAACSGMAAELELPSIEPSIYGVLPAAKLVDKGKQHYRDGEYGLAEEAFRGAVEQDRNNAEAWLGLAASYDRLSRFDLAERTYKVVVKLAGRTSPVLNNIGYHHILRGDYAAARRVLAQARQADPHNLVVQKNLDLLSDAEGARAWRPVGG